MSILSKQGFQHHLNNIEEQAKWVQYYDGEPELMEVMQNSIKLSKEILTQFFDDTHKEVYIILSKTQPEIVDFTFYTEIEAVEKRIEYLNSLARKEEFWYLTLFSNHRNAGEVEKTQEN
jgi:transcription antitermination factor NusA-like protein